MYTIKTKENGFSLEIIFTIYDTDENLMLGTMIIHVVSDDFSAKTTMEVSAYDVAAFARDLNHLYEHLSGTATLTEAFSFSNNSKIQFSAIERGYIEVKGKLTEGFQTLIFDNAFDQTYLKDFATDLYHDYKQYLK